MKQLFIFLSIIFISHINIFSSGLETKGIGARSRGMGFAMSSIEGDVSNVHFNPAGIAWAKNDTFGFEYEFFTGGIKSTKSLRNLSPHIANPLKGDFIDFIGDEPSSFNKNSISSDIHYVSFAYIFNFNKFNMGIGMYGSGSGTAWEDSILNSYGDLISAKVEFINGSLNIPFAFSYQLSKYLSIGLNIGFHWGLLDYEVSKNRKGNISYTSNSVQDTQGAGISTDIGMLIKLLKNLNCSLVIKFPYTFKKVGTTHVQETLLEINDSTDTTVYMYYPYRIVFGSSFNPIKNLLIAFDITWLNWEKYKVKTLYSKKIPSLFEDSYTNPFKWQNTFVYNFGLEYILSNKWTIRGGVTYDEAPEPEEYRILTGGQVLDAWLFSIGSSYKTKKGSIDFGYINTYAPEKNGFIEGAKYKMNLHEFFIGYVKKY